MWRGARPEWWCGSAGRDSRAEGIGPGADTGGGSGCTDLSEALTGMGDDSGLAHRFALLDTSPPLAGRAIDNGLEAPTISHMEPMDTRDLSDYFDRTKAHSQRALAKLGHFSSRRLPSASEEASKEASEATTEPERSTDESAA